MSFYFSFFGSFKQAKAFVFGVLKVNMIFGFSEKTKELVYRLGTS